MSSGPQVRICGAYCVTVPALNMLCEAQTITLGPPQVFGSSSDVKISKMLSFDIQGPTRAARVLFKPRAARTVQP